MSENENRIFNLCNSYGDWWKKGFETPEMTDKLYPYDMMFSPIKIGKLTIKNRIVMAPMGNIDMCEETGRPNIKMLKYFEERAKGGVGLITSGLVPVSFGIDKSLIELGDLSYFPRIDRSRTVYVGWRDLAAMCHAHGANFFIQLTPGLGRVGNPQCLLTQKALPRSASFNPNWYMPDVPCARLSDHSLGKIIKNAGQAAADAKAANIDGVYLHGHEGYLLEQCTNTAFNHRKLGKYSDWMRFGVDMIKQIRKRVGDNYPIMYRIDMSVALNATYGDRMKEGGLYLKKFINERKADETLKYMAELVKAGVDVFDIDLGCYDNWWLPHPPASMPAGCFLEISEITKKYFKENNIKSNLGVEVPIVAVGKLGYPDLAEKALRDGKCDMIMLGRPLLADADWPNKAYAGKCSDIRPCIGCQEGCLNEFVEGGHPQCAVNPRTAFEEELSAEIPKAEKQKKVAVIGAGPAGIVAAEVLLKRGHKVDMFEKADRIGGSVIPAAVPKIKFDMKNYLTYLEHVVEEMKKDKAFSITLGKEVQMSDIKDKYDVIITASGAKQVRPSEKAIPGINNKNVLFAVDVLNNPNLVAGAKNVVVIGGGVVGAETAYMLKYEKGIDVKVVEMQKFIMNHTCTANRGHIIHYLEKAGVELLNCTKLMKIDGNTVVLAQNIHKSRPNPYVTWSPILPENITNPLDMLKPYREEFVERREDADFVLLAMGVAPTDKLYFECVNNHAAPEIYNIGDSYRGARVFEAVRGAYRKARSI